jgi:glycosyltransferase involved in cell wall biosynthesis
MLSCSGIGTVVKNLIPPLSTAPFTTQLIVHSNDLEKGLQISSHKVCNAPIYSIQEQFALPKQIPSCDLFWSPHYNVPIFPIRAKKRIVTIHDAYHLAFQHLLGWKEKLYANMMFRQAACRSDAILTDSQFSKEEICRLLSISPDLVRVIYPGVDFDRFSRKASPEALKLVQKKYALPNSFFLFVGNVKPHKNLKLILDAYQQIPIDIPLVILGKTSGLRKLDPSMQRIECDPLLRERTYFTGEVLDEELPAFYQMATSLVFPSLYEGFGLPPLEAMAAGCPAIVSSRASLPEVCGNAAHFIDANDAIELGEAMGKIAGDAVYRKELQEKGKVRAQQFSWGKTASQYRDVFREIHFR